MAWRVEGGGCGPSRLESWKLYFMVNKRCLRGFAAFLHASADRNPKRRDEIHGGGGRGWGEVKNDMSGHTIFSFGLSVFKWTAP